MQADRLAVAGRTSELAVRQESKALGFAASHRRAWRSDTGHEA